MPKKKRSSIGYNTSKARKNKALRRATASVKHAELVLAEPPDLSEIARRRELLKLKDRIRHRLRLERETSEERQLRRERDRIRHRNARHSEVQKLKDRRRHRLTKERETSKERQLRREKDRIRHQNHRVAAKALEMQLEEENVKRQWLQSLRAKLLEKCSSQLPPWGEHVIPVLSWTVIKEEPLEDDSADGDSQSPDGVQMNHRIHPHGDGSDWARMSTHGMSCYDGNTNTLPLLCQIRACEEDLNSGKNDEQCKESAASDDPSKDDEEMEETNEIIVPSEESVVSKDDTEMDLASEATVEPSKNDDIPEAVADAVTKETSSAIDTSKKKVVTAKSDANSKKTSTNRGNAASEVSKTKYAKIDEYDPDVEVGAEFVVPLSGLFCKLCRKFYRDTELVKVHCKSQTHYLNFLVNKKNSSPKQKAAKDQEQAKTSPKASAADSKGLKQEKDDVLADLHIKKDLAEGETLFDDETFPHSESVASSCSAADEAQEPAEEPKVVVKRNRSVPTPDKKLSPVKRSTRRKKNQ